MKLKAKAKFENVIDTRVGRTRKAGEIFEADDERAKVLLNANLVYVVEEKEEVKEIPVAEEKPVKKPKNASKKK